MIFEIMKIIAIRRIHQIIYLREDILLQLINSYNALQLIKHSPLLALCLCFTFF